MALTVCDIMDADPGTVTPADDVESVDVVLEALTRDEARAPDAA